MELIREGLNVENLEGVLQDVTEGGSRLEDCDLMWIDGSTEGKSEQEGLTGDKFEAKRF